MASCKITISGFGGQGILFLGQMLCYAASDIGRKVSWLPSYGPEMRGGTANCMVEISDTEIYSPLILNPDVLLAMNKPSLVRFEKAVKPGGVIILNKDMIDIKVNREDVKQVWISANKIAENLGNTKVSNMVALGALIGVTGIIELDDVLKAIEKKLPANKREALQVNKEALSLGYQGAIKYMEDNYDKNR